MGRFGQIINVIGLLNGIFAIAFGLLYLNGGAISKEQFVGWFLIIMGLFYVVGYLILFAIKVVNRHKQIKAMAAQAK